MKVTSMRKKHPRKAQSSSSDPKQRVKQGAKPRSGQPKGQHNHASRSKSGEMSGSAITCPRDAVMIWGRHAVGEALKNPKRKFLKLYASPDMMDWLAEHNRLHDLQPIVMEKPAMTEGLRTATPDDQIVHQGIIAIARPLHQPSLEDWLDQLDDERPLVVLLDQITDARNIGAIMRSARAFRVSAMIATDRHCPDENGAMLRTASGAMDHLPLIRVVNLARAMEKLQDHGFMLAGMTARGDVPLRQLADYDRLGIIMGAEGKGLRRLTEDHADLLVRIPIDDQAESLNVSNAAAVALYAAQPAD